MYKFIKNFINHLHLNPYFLIYHIYSNLIYLCYFHDENQFIHLWIIYIYYRKIIQIYISNTIIFFYLFLYLFQIISYIIFINKYIDLNIHFFIKIKNFPLEIKKFSIHHFYINLNVKIEIFQYFCKKLCHNVLDL